MTTFQENLMREIYSEIQPKISSGFHALSDPLRIAILELLKKQELCVKAIL